ncbi:MAG: metallophosphoesterase, partial [Solirubrobacteraceae bacterium]
MPLFGRRGPRGRAYRCFFATDLHGSDRCFRKFLAAASAYEADVLLLGGDVAGKAIVPVEKCPGGRLRYSF